MQLGAHSGYIWALSEITQITEISLKYHSGITQRSARVDQKMKKKDITKSRPKKITENFTGADQLPLTCYCYFWPGASFMFNIQFKFIANGRIRHEKEAGI